MQPSRQHHAAFAVAGPSVRTTNREESEPGTARIGALWGAFDVTAGTPVAAGSPGSVAVEAGDYLVFSGRGEMPQTVIALWQRIWQFFDAHPEVVRRFRSDFEAYGEAGAVAIHIGVE